MIYQLPNGRIIEMSLEQYLELDDQDFRDLNGLGKEFTSDITNPFYKQIPGVKPQPCWIDITLELK